MKITFQRFYNVMTYGNEYDKAEIKAAVSPARYAAMVAQYVRYFCHYED